MSSTMEKFIEKQKEVARFVDRLRWGQDNLAIPNPMPDDLRDRMDSLNEELELLWDQHLKEYSELKNNSTQGETS